jgi:hypothetical protein
MGISWSMIWWGIGMWAAAWTAAKAVSIRWGWDNTLVEDSWVRLCCVAGGLTPLLHFWTLLFVPLLLWAYADAAQQARKVRIRAAQRAAYDQWWSRTEYRWERKWERVPKRGN